MSEPLAQPASLAKLFAAPATSLEGTLASAQARSEAAVAAAWHEGHAAATAELGDALESLQVSLAATERQRALEAAEMHGLAGGMAMAIEKRFASALATLALAATETILNAQPEPGAATLESLIIQAASGLGGGTLYLAPETVERARPLAPPGWTVAAREGLATGTVEAECGPALQRASLMDRLEQLLDAHP